MSFDVIGENHHISINDPRIKLDIVKGEVYIGGKPAREFGFSDTEKLEIVSLMPIQIKVVR